MQAFNPSDSQEEEAVRSLEFEASEFRDSKGYTMRPCLRVVMGFPSVARLTQGWEGGLQSTLTWRQPVVRRSPGC